MSQRFEIKTVAEQLLFSTVLIRTNGPSGAGTGTGFVFAYAPKGNDESAMLFVVTNKHVVGGATEGEFSFSARNGDQPIIGRSVNLKFNDFAAAWHGHPLANVDIAIMPLSPVLHELQGQGIDPFLRTLDNSSIPNDQQLRELDAVEEVLFVGYPRGIIDSKNLTPIARRGTTATHPQLDYEGQPQFLIDASVFPGSSGSPVFITNSGSFSPRSGGLHVGERLLLLEVVASVFWQPEIGKVVPVPIPTQDSVAVVRQMIDLGVVFKSRTILETVFDFAREKGICL